MAVKKQTAAGATLADEEIEGGTDTPADIADVVEAPAPATVASIATAAERTRSRRIMDAASVAGLPLADITALVASNKTVEQALDDITAKWKEDGDVDKPMIGAPTMVITRDEVDTRRQGMTAALVAQMRGRAPTDDKAKPYMGLGLIDIAAQSIGHKGPIRSAGDKIDIFMAASHSRSDFTGIFENALNKNLLERYSVQVPTYKAISRKRNFNDFRVHPMVRAGDFPKLQAVAENGEIKYGTFGERRETAVLSSYGVALRISRQMMIDDDLMAIDDVVGDYGSAIANFEEETFYAFMLSAVLSSDGGAVWQTSVPNRGGNLAAAGAAITVASLAAGRAVMRKQTSIESVAGKADGIKLNLAPSILLVGPDKETEADQLITSITPNLVGSVNPFSGRLTVVSTAQITGNLWMLFADPSRAGGACFVHGFLNGAEAPRLRTEEPFGQQGMAMSVEHDFGLGATDFRGTYRNPGA